jgi:Family of unknown function (DUF5359)
VVHIKKVDRILLILLAVHFVLLLFVQGLFALTDASQFMNKVTYYEGVMKELPTKTIAAWKNSSSHR